MQGVRRVEDTSSNAVFGLKLRTKSANMKGIHGRMNGVPIACTQ